jgi:hypothetical protein
MSSRSPAKFETTIDLGDRKAPLIARINRRARRLIVKVDALSGRVLVTAPSKRALPAALDFAKTRAIWISAQLKEGGSAKPFHDGAVFPLRGSPVLVVHDGGPRAGVRLEHAQLFAGGEAAHLNRRIIDWLKAEARKIVTERADHYSGALGRKRGPISIRDTRSRWGSCARDGSLSFSWRLILAPPPMLDYVAAHECAHLVHLDHSPAYWRVLKGLGVDARAARDWFAAHGRALHAYGRERVPAERA